MEPQIYKKTRRKTLLKSLSSAALGLLLVVPIAVSHPARAVASDAYVADSFSDFDQGCATLSGTQVTDVPGEYISMSSAFRDDFSSVLNGRWTSGTWDPGSYTPATFSGGPETGIEVGGDDGAYIIGNSSYSSKTLQGRVSFTGSNWNHFGWTDSTSFNHFILVGTMNDGDLHARFYDGSTLQFNVDLGTQYLGDFHTYRIENTSGVRVYVDGILVASSGSSDSTQMYVVASNNSQVTDDNLLVDYATVEAYGTEGYYLSCAIDSGSSNTIWGALNYDVVVPAKFGSVSVKTQTSSDGSSWSGLSSAISNGNQASSTAARYLRYRIEFTKASERSPYVRAVRINYATVSGATSHFFLTTMSDFNCTQSDTAATDKFGGEVRLSGGYREEMTSGLSGSWTAGTWNVGTYTPSYSFGALQMKDTSNGAYLIGNNSYTAGATPRTLEARVSFSNNNWQHIGWADSTSFNDYAILSTYNNGFLNFRVNDGNGEEIYKLNPHYRITGPGINYHIVRIEMLNGNTLLYIDDVLYVNSSTEMDTNMKPIMSNNDTNSLSDLWVDWLEVRDYPTDPSAVVGTYTSCNLDSGAANSDWQLFSFTKEDYDHFLYMEVSTRTSNDGSSWSGWSTPDSDGTINSSAGRYLQYKVEYKTENPEQTNALKDVLVTYQ